MKKIGLLILIVAALSAGYLVKKDSIDKALKIDNFLGKIKGEKKMSTNDQNAKQVIKREDIDQRYKWNLADIYVSWEAWQQDFDKVNDMIHKFSEFKGTLKDNPDNFRQMMKMDEEISKILEKVSLYPYMQKDLNSKDDVASEKMQKIETLYVENATLNAWTTPEILSIDKNQIDEWVEKYDDLKPYKFSLNEIFRLQGHILDEEKEKLLSHYGQFMGAPDDIYGELSISDVKWNDVELSDGYKGPITNGMYSKVLSTNRNQDDRKKAFEALYKVYDDKKNTYGAIYKSLLQRDVATSRAKNYNSSLDKALEPKNVPFKVYESLLQSAIKNSAPLRRYVELRKKALNLEEYHYYDNSINIVDYNKEFPYDIAKNIVLKSVEPLGLDYVNKLTHAIGDGWLDVFETENKRSGAYSIGIYGVHPYMLLNYQSTLDDMFTLAHELGHTLHTMLSNENQPYATSSYTIFVAEVASTFNERLLIDYMLKNSEDHKEKIAILEQALGNIVGTFYIQTLFANYEYQAHKLVENGEPVTPKVLDNIMESLFKEYFGDTLTMDELQKVIWARIPHFFNSPYYVYQYATSFASSANLYDKITNEKYSEDERNAAKERYLTLLKSGGNDNPMNQLKKAGVNLEDSTSFDAVAVEFNRLLDLLEKELEEYNNK